MKQTAKKQNTSLIIAVVLVIVSFLIAVRLLSNVVTEHYDNEIIVCLDAGHGGSDVGATSTDGKRYEKDDNLRLTLKVRDELEAMGVTVILTREDDTAVSLKERCKTANRKRADLFVSLHRNSSATGTGIEAWIANRPKQAEKNVANKLTKAVSEATGLENRGVKTGFRDSTANNYYVNANTRMPSVLLEVAFISSPEDNKAFDNNFDAMASEIAKVIYDAVQN